MLKIIKRQFLTKFKIIKKVKLKKLVEKLSEVYYIEKNILNLFSIHKFSKNMEDVKKDITDNQNKIIMDSLMEL